jgi:hypothetical protein
VNDGAHLRRAIRPDRVGVVPEIQAVDVPVVEPQADVMGMIDALVGARLERPASRDDGPGRGADRVERGLLLIARIDVRGEGFAVDRDIHPCRRRIRRHLNPRRVGADCGGQQQRDQQKRSECLAHRIPF